MEEDGAGSMEEDDVGWMEEDDVGPMEEDDGPTDPRRQLFACVVTKSTLLPFAL